MFWYKVVFAVSKGCERKTASLVLKTEPVRGGHPPARITPEICVVALQVGEGNLERRALRAEKEAMREMLYPVMQAEEDRRHVSGATRLWANGLHWACTCP